MPKTRSQKEAEMKLLGERIEKSKGLVFTVESGVAVQDMEQFRRDLREDNCGYQVVKKTLWKLLAKDRNWETPEGSEHGTVGVAYSTDDEVAAARTAAKFSKAHEGFQVVGGVLDDTVIGQEQVMALAQLPGKQELLSMLLRTVQGPVSGFANVLAGNIRGLVTALNAIKETK